jgi:hypothetical protein
LLIRFTHLSTGMTGRREPPIEERSTQGQLAVVVTTSKSTCSFPPFVVRIGFVSFVSFVSRGAKGQGVKRETNETLRAGRSARRQVDLRLNWLAGCASSNGHRQKSEHGRQPAPERDGERWKKSCPQT